MRNFLFLLKRNSKHLRNAYLQQAHSFTHCLESEREKLIDGEMLAFL
jgi:hypothetical protein